MRVLVVIDSHCILNQYPDPKDKYKIKRLLDVYAHGEFFDQDMVKHNIQIKHLVLGDSKPYWRTFMFPEYKANRPKRSLAFPKALQIEGYQNTIYIERFEADDIAGLIWRMWPKLRAEFDFLIMATVDSDWCQLLTEKDIIIEDMKGYNPPHRSSTSCWLWVKAQLKSTYVSKKNKTILEAIIESEDNTTVDYWSKVIRTYKWVAGDKTDNIPPNAEEYLTNILIPPPREFGPELDSYQPHIHHLLNKQPFLPAKYNAQYLEDCIIFDHARTPILNQNEFNQMQVEKYVTPDLLAFLN